LPVEPDLQNEFGASAPEWLTEGFSSWPCDTAEQSQDSDRLREHLHSLAAGRSAHLGSGCDLADDFPIETGWCGIVAIVFSSERPRRRYLGAKLLLDRLAAGVIGLLGVKLISEVR
jgi:hypothetical protein